MGLQKVRAGILSLAKDFLDFSYIKAKGCAEKESIKQIPPMSHPIQNPLNRNSKRKVLNFDFFSFFLS
jgi:hypothetical protein